MKDWKGFFKGKKITVMGLGLLGRGVGDTRFLAEQGAELIVTDLKSESDLASSLEELSGFPGITYRLGGHDKADFQGRDFILKAAGVPLDSPFIAEARKNGIPVKMSASWFAELSGIPVVGVTGTRGKSTTTQLLYEVMKAAGMDVLLGGNVRGVSTLALLPQAKEGSMAVMELDSWQCQGFGDEKMSPHVAVFTTFYPDHLNYYKNDMDAYLADKAQVFLNQKPEDTLVVSNQASPFVQGKYGDRIRAHVVIADPGDFPSDWKTHLPGVHNVLDEMCALAAARSLGISDATTRSAMAAFKGVPGRLELVRELHGVLFYNDTTATTPEATIAALHAVPSSRLILIMGGADKGLDMSELLTLVHVYAKKLILLAGTGTERIRGEFPDAVVYDDLGAALASAVKGTQEGDVVLFSPAFASFGMFKNEFDRGDKFNELVEKLP